MQAQVWDALLRKIPANYHAGLSVSTLAGAEIILQSIIRLEPTHALVRGRPAGSTDGGRIMIIPFDQIDFVSFTQRLSEAEVQAIFGSATTNFPEISVRPEQPEANGTPPAESPVKNLTTPPAPPEPANKSGRPSKSMLLAKLRARLGESSRGSGK